MKDFDFLYAINDIDDEFITEAADDEKIKEAFCAEWGEEDNDAANAGEGEQTESDTAAEENEQNRNYNSGGELSAKKRKNFKLLFLVAVIIMLMISMGVFMASGNLFSINLRDEIYEIIGKTVQVDRQELSADPDKYTESTSKLVDNLKEKGFENILLPKAILNDDWQFVYVQFNDNFPIIAGANIDLITQKGEVDFILSYIRYEEYKNNEINHETAVKMKEINISGVDVVITLYKSGKKSIHYVTREEIDNMTEQMEYSFYFYSDYTYEEVLEIAKTIG